MDSPHPVNPATDGHSGNERRTTLSDRVRSLRLAREAGGGARSRSSALPWALCIVLGLAAVGFAWRSYRLASPGTETAASAANTPSTGTSSSAVASSGEVALVSKGYIIPAHRIQVSPDKANGILVHVSPRLEEGQQFKEGEVLARIRDTDFKARRDKLTSVVVEARRRLDELEKAWPEEIKQLEARRDLANAKLSIARIKLQNFKNARTGSTAEDVANAESVALQEQKNVDDAERALFLNKLTRKEQIAQAQARIEQGEADLTEAQWLLDNCEIKAPVTGIILQKNAEKGNFVNPGALSSGTGGIAVSLCDMADLTDLEVDLSIQERDIAKLVVGQPCVVMPESRQKDPRFLKIHPRGYEAQVSRIMPIADRAKGSVSVRVKLKVDRKEEGLYLKPDTGVIVTFLKVEEWWLFLYFPAPAGTQGKQE